MYVDQNGEFFFLAGLIGFGVGYLTHGITTNNWGMVSGFKSGALSLVGAGVGFGVSAGAGALGMGGTVAGIIGGTTGGAASGALGAAITPNGNIGMGALTGGLGGLLGSSMGLAGKNWGFGAKAALSTLGGGAVGGGLAAMNGGSFWEGARNGAIGGAVGFLANEIAGYVKQSRAEQKYMREKLGLTKEEIKCIKSYGLGKIINSDPIGGGDAMWESLKAGHSKLDGIFETLRSIDYKGKDGQPALIKAGRMHIRYGTGEMAAKGYQMGDYPGAIRFHFDRFDVVLFPLSHLIFDSAYQWALGVH